MLRPCIGCGRLIESGSRCAECQPAPRQLRGRPWRRMRERVFAAKGRTCVYCGNPATEVDHVEPVTAGGMSTIDNLVPACRSCNQRKGCSALKPGSGNADPGPRVQARARSP